MMPDCLSFSLFSSGFANFADSSNRSYDNLRWFAGGLRLTPIFISPCVVVYLARFGVYTP